MQPKFKKEARLESVAVNRQARHDYYILEAFEAGIVLQGGEVKSIREGTVALKEGYAHVSGGELYLEGVHITPYSYAKVTPPPAVRSRKLLMHRREINRIQSQLAEKKLTLVPLRVYFKNGRAKVEIGLAKGKKLHDKRASIKEKELKRTVDRAERKFRS
jgi:SsrA-binding protein